MTEYVDRDAAITAIKGNCWAAHAPIEAVRSVPTADVIQAPPWSPASEKPAEDFTDVLVYFEYYRYGSYNCMFRTFGISYTVHGEWSCFVNGQSGWRDLNILYWMPLPEPPKEV